MARPCAIDTSLILTLSSASHLGFFLSKSRYNWCITPLVRGELTRRETREPVDSAITQGKLRVTALDMNSEREVELWTRWSLLVDLGEAETIALAIARGWLVALEDRQAQRALDREEGDGHWINCATLLLDATEDQVLSLADADRIFQSLDSYPGYKKRGVASLATFRRPE